MAPKGGSNFPAIAVVTQITFIHKTRSKPSLEFYSDGGIKARRVMIEKSPFRIGRAESCDLRLDSAQASREHAELLDRGGVWFVRDLGSTNGTLVNGKKVGETLLTDGDILKVAEAELTFIASPTSQFQRMVTQPIHARDRSSATSPSIPREIAAARALAEATLWQAIPVEFSAVVSLRHDAVEAIFANAAADNAATDPPALVRSHVAAARYRELCRLRAVEIAQEARLSERLFVSVGAGDIEAQERLFAELELLQELLLEDFELGIRVPLRAVVETAQAAEFHRGARDRGLLLAYDGFHGNAGQLMQIDAQVPDYLLLSQSMTKGLPDTSQPLQLESVLSACEEFGIKPVLPRSGCEQTLAHCRQIGFDLMIEHSTTPLKARMGELVGAM